MTPCYYVPRLPPLASYLHGYHWPHAPHWNHVESTLQLFCSKVLAPFFLKGKFSPSGWAKIKRKFEKAPNTDEQLQRLRPFVCVCHRLKRKNAIAVDRTSVLFFTNYLLCMWTCLCLLVCIYYWNLCVMSKSCYVLILQIVILYQLFCMHHVGFHVCFAHCCTFVRYMLACMLYNVWKVDCMQNEARGHCQLNEGVVSGKLCMRIILYLSMCACFVHVYLLLRLARFMFILHASWV